MQPTVKSEKAIDLAHPLGVAVGEVIVDGDDMHAVAGQGVEVDRQGRDQGLTFAGLHFGDHAAMQHDAAHQLHVEMALAERALSRLAHRREGIGQQIVELRPIRELLPELSGAFAQLVIRQRFELRLHLVDRGDDGPEALDVAIVGGAEQPPG